jgi:hypothetical protein
MMLEVSDTELAAARADAEALMVDGCVVTRPGGDPVFDEDTGRYVDPPPVTVYSGECQVQVRGDGSASDVAAGEREATVQRPVVKLPVSSSTGVRVGNTVTVTHAEHDAELLGRKFRVNALHHKTFATSRRLRCEEVTG